MANPKDDKLVGEIADLVWAKQAQDYIESLSLPIAVVPNSCDIVELDDYSLEPRFYKASLKTSNVEHFLKYVGDHKCWATQVFVDPDKATAIAILDIGTPEEPQKGVHRARLELRETPEMVALRQLVSKPVGQEQLLDFFTDWEHLLHFEAHNMEDLVGVTEGKIEAKEGIKLYRKLRATKEQSIGADVEAFKKSQSAFDVTALRSGSSELPDTFVLSTNVYEDFFFAEVRCKITCTSPENMMFKLRVVGLQNLLALAGADLKRRIETSLVGNGTDDTGMGGVYFGQMEY